MDRSRALEEQRQLAFHGVVILLLGLMAGIGFSVAAATAEVSNPSYGAWRFAHMEGLLNGVLVLAVAGVWLRMNLDGRGIHLARYLLVLGCYANIIGPIINALFIGKRLIVPETNFEAFVVYGFYIPGTLPLISFVIFAFNLFARRRP
ncbi:Uncharacterised protein [Zhongshania aliphaticivorans]|uniref:Uncharacterized protein n=2 Tax=Zhongshania aliphaticivorans TaxID=1470434 RepID=A0A5S9MTS2_9GAMM|nr:Uncharacterised protein [Zhongshania aliphaticivorans]CAA0085874.1 Uncharacterised protein [Zhongshania aliphaticivorans]